MIKNENTTPIRLKRQPQLLVSELLTTASLLNQTFINTGSNFVLTPKTLINKQNGYFITNKSMILL